MSLHSDEKQNPAEASAMVLATFSLSFQFLVPLGCDESRSLPDGHCKLPPSLESAARCSASFRTAASTRHPKAQATLLPTNLSKVHNFSFYYLAEMDDTVSVPVGVISEQRAMQNNSIMRILGSI